MGDGGTSEPDFHVGMTFAGVWKCPVVVVCQNNGWAISVPTSAQTASPTIAVKGRGYGIPSIRVDGNDVLAMVKVTRDAVERARRGEGPTFIEAVTYRRQGHSSSDDPNVYRNPDDVKVWEQRDPIDRFRAHLVARELWSKDREFAEIERQNELVTREIQEAEKSSPPALDTLIEDVTGTIRPELREQLAEVRPYFEEGKIVEGAFPL
jgi:pyruvate dehydrogenase E1 component alpha subunit/2-oxoisovalerate dehydrogenase E1 component alpha subunit